MRGLLVLTVVMGLLVAGSPARGDEIPRCHEYVQGARVGLVGDSHTYGPGCDSYPGWTVDAQIGRGSEAALPVLDQMLRPSWRVVVFDIATNDAPIPEVLRENLRTLWPMIGDRRLVLVTSYVRSDEGNFADEVNAVLRDFASNHPQRTEIVNWAGLARQHPEWMGPDNIHFYDPGYEARVDLIRSEVRSLPELLRKRKRR